MTVVVWQLVKVMRTAAASMAHRCITIDLNHVEFHRFEADPCRCIERPPG